MKPFLDTDRLSLRRFTEDDVTPLRELDSDPEVMRYLTNGRPTALPVIRDEVLPRILAEYAEGTGYGCWAAVERASGEFIGWLALRQRADRAPDDVELGYRLRRRFWGRGYATEGARAVIARGFTEFGARRIFAETMAVNHASRRVLERSGLHWVRTFHLHFPDPIPGTVFGEVEYALDRDAWASGRPRSDRTR